MGTRQNNKGANRKVESNDSLEIPDRGETSDEPGLPYVVISFSDVVMRDL